MLVKISSVELKTELRSDLGADTGSRTDMTAM